MTMMTETAPTDKPQTFRALVAEVAARAKERLPQAINGRLEGAVRLVLAHEVTTLDDGRIEVGSCADPMKVYTLAGTACTCEDFQYNRAPGGWCKHRIAAGIDKRVRELLPETPQTLTQDEPLEAPAPCPEALFSATLKGTIDGHETLLTARGQTAEEFRRNLEAIRGLLDQPQATQPLTPQQHGATHRPSVGFCAVHSVEMTLNTGKDGRQWYSHRLPEGGFCKGR